MKEEKKSNGVLFIIIMLICILAIGYWMGLRDVFKFKSDDKCAVAPEAKKEEIEKKPVHLMDDKEFEKLEKVSEEDLASIYPLIGYDKDMYTNTYSTIFDFLSVDSIPVGTVNNFKQGEKQFIVYHYAMRNNMYHVIEGKKETDYCYAGDGSCIGVTRSDYEKIKKLYNITDSFISFYSDFIFYNQDEKLGDVALYTYGGWVQSNWFKHINIDARYYDVNMMVLRDIVEVYDVRDENLEKVLEKAVIEYHFIKLDGR